MSAIVNFCRGFAWQHVDYHTRHHSKAYDIGRCVSGILLALIPFAICFGLGFIAGRFW